MQRNQREQIEHINNFTVKLNKKQNKKHNVNDD